jgi:uncharacterized membrane protein
MHTTAGNYHHLKMERAMRPPRHYMTKMEQKILEYLEARKTPVTQKDLAVYFCVSTSSISNAITELEAAGLLIVSRVGNTKTYRFNHVSKQKAA